MTAVSHPAKNILVVDDDAATRDLLVRLLASRGYAATVAAGGREALERLRNQPPPDLILLDLVMPGMNGGEFRRQQLQDAVLASIPVVILSVEGEIAQQADELGDVGYLQKPVVVDELIAAVERFARPRKPGILVVDDEMAVARMLEVALRHHGFAVHLAGGGQEAVQLYQRHQETIDVVLCDVQMPDPDGPSTLARLRIINPSVRYCFMTANPGKYTGEALRALGAAHVFQKPFASLAELTRALWQMAHAS
jgi:CheY-like chemotaxis protein